MASIAGTTLGRTSRNMIRQSFAPWARAAVTNSRCDQTSVFARVMRARVGIAIRPNVNVSVTRPAVSLEPSQSTIRGSRKIESDSARTSAGTDSSTSIAPMVMVSSLPRR